VDIKPVANFLKMIDGQGAVSKIKNGILGGK